MTATVLIAAATCLALTLSVLIKPNITIKGKTFGLYWIISLIGAVTLILIGSVSLSEVWQGLSADREINPIKILILFISMTLLSVFLDETGFFSYIASAVQKKAGKDQHTLFLILYITVSILTVFTSNDIIILTFTPIILCFCKNARISPLPYLFGEFVAANTWSMALIIGNPTNIYLASANNISFFEYASKMLLPTMAAGVTAYLVLALIFSRSLKTEMTPSYEETHIKDKVLLILGISHLAVCTVLLIIGSYIGVEMWAVALFFAVSLLISSSLYRISKKKKPKEAKKALIRAPWELIPFVTSMFIIVLSLDGVGIPALASTALSKLPTVFAYGISSTLTANLINNIPMSVLFCPIITSGAETADAVYASIIGSNIGAFLTPVGALAGIMWSSILKRYNCAFSFLSFVKYGTACALPTLMAALSALYIF